jgi:hypothetical protein
VVQVHADTVQVAVQEGSILISRIQSLRERGKVGTLVIDWIAPARPVVSFMRERFFSLSVNRWSKAVLVCSLCMVFTACAARQSAQQRVASPSEAASTQPAETGPLVYYVGVDQLAVYSEPRSSAAPLTRLPLHKKVYRSKMEKGYAYITVEGSKVTGWVDNARLIWRLPSQQKAPTKPEEQTAEPAPAAPVVEETPPTPEPAVEVAAPEPTPTTAESPTKQQPASPAAAPARVSPAPSAPTVPSEPRPIEPSIFNPF